MPLTPATRLGSYEIVGPLGAGGMGEVYRARDLRLGRDVALKVLPDDVAISPDRLARFEREARAVAALNHPNIVTLHSIEDHNGIRFLTMEVIEGQSLDQHILPGGLPIPRVLEVGITLADALSAAHEKGVVHRDLKPANVMLTREGRLKVLDFGLAKVAALDGDSATMTTGTSPFTTVGTVAGTIPYMAPEQLVGSPVDARTDLVSLGILLYELAAGRRPFEGATLAEIGAAILSKEPLPLASARKDLPSDLGRVVARCLDKDRERRIQTAKDVRNELEAIRRGIASEVQAIPGFGGRPAIAVLPFENRSGDPEQEYFADGLAEDLISRLSLWRAFPVIARNSSFSYKGSVIDLKRVSAELGVRYVVQGSVRKASNRVRIAAQLVDASTGQNVWTQTFDRDLTDVFAVQDEISEAIAASLIVDLQRAEYTHVRQRAPESLEAWGLYQRALPLLCSFGREEFREARRLLERATELEPQFSTAWARLTEVATWELLYGWTDTPEATLKSAIAYARRAVELDPRDVDAHTELSYALMTAGDGVGAVEEARRAIELNPSHPKALLFHAYVWHMTGHPAEESIERVHRAMRLSPRDPVEWLFYDVLAGAYFNAGRYEEGLTAGRRLVALYPDYYFGYVWNAMNAVELGQMDVARAAVQEARRQVPDLSIAMLRRVLGAMGPEVDRRMMGALARAGLP